MSDTLRISGGKKLKGVIKPQGSKNEAFQVIAAALLTEEDVVIENVPNILDITNLFEILKTLGVTIKQISKDSFRLNSSAVDVEKMKIREFTQLFSKLRGSLLIAGAMLGRFGTSIIQQPGGDKIGVRPVATHIHGFIDLGATAESNGDFQKLTLSHIASKRITMREASVTGTANVILASVLEKDTPHTIEIYNAACEPYIQQLCSMLNNMGAQISGIGTNLLTISSVSKLHGTDHILAPDMIEIVSLISLSVVCGEGVLIEGAKLENIGTIATIVLGKLGVSVEERSDGIFIPEHAHYEIKKPTTPGKTIRVIYDAIWPGLSPDHISSLIVLSVYAKGIVTIRQRMFDRRLIFCDVLNTMGAEIVMSHHQEVTVIGNGRNRRLVGISMASPDIRAGMALLIAALSADGESIIKNAHQIDRGYEHIVERLQAIGASIEAL